MMIDMETAAAGWIRAQLQALQRTDELFRSVALDDLLGAAYAKPWQLDVALEAYREAVTACAPDADRFMAALVVPLTSSETLEPGIPDSMELHEDQPPALYLFDRHFFMGFNDFEEYRVPVPALVEDMPDGRVCAYYTCYRDPMARVNDWEYARALWHQHFA